MRINIQSNENSEIQKKNSKNGKDQMMNMFDKLYENKGKKKNVNENLNVNNQNSIEKKINKGEDNSKKEIMENLILSRKDKLNLIEIPKDMGKKLNSEKNMNVEAEIRNGLADKKVNLKEVPVQDIKVNLRELLVQDKKTNSKEINQIGEQELIKKEDKLILLSNKIKADSEINVSIKDKLLTLIENKKEPIKTIDALKKEIHKKENLENSFEIVQNKDMIRFESKMEMKEWVGKLKSELKNMLDFKIENDNKIRLHLNSEEGFIKINIEKINNEFVIRSESSDSLRKRVDEILAEVKIEMRDRNIEVRFEKDKEDKDSKKNEEEDTSKNQRGDKDGSDNSNEQRRRNK